MPHITRPTPSAVPSKAPRAPHPVQDHRRPDGPRVSAAVDRLQAQAQEAQSSTQVAAPTIPTSTPAAFCPRLPPPAATMPTQRATTTRTRSGGKRLTSSGSMATFLRSHRPDTSPTRTCRSGSDMRLLPITLRCSSPPPTHPRRSGCKHGRTVHQTHLVLGRAG